MLFGASYYAEYQPYDRLGEDVRMMHEAGMTFMRIGDSIWARCEATEGRFEIDWIEPILDALHGGDIKVILATPSYAIPPWLHRRHPEIMAKRRLAGALRRPPEHGLHAPSVPLLSRTHHAQAARSLCAAPGHHWVPG